MPDKPVLHKAPDPLPAAAPKRSTAQPPGKQSRTQPIGLAGGAARKAVPGTPTAASLQQLATQVSALGQGVPQLGQHIAQQATRLLNQLEITSGHAKGKQLLEMEGIDPKATKQWLEQLQALAAKAPLAKTD